jgi:uncharacterized protein YkwD
MIIPLLFTCTSRDQCNNDYVTLNQYYTYTEKETDLILGINIYRESNNLPPLSTVNYLSIVSVPHVDKLIETNQINHDGFGQRVEEINKYSCDPRIGEILAYNYITNISVINAWDSSPEHRHILIDEKYNSIGVCVRQDADNRYYYMAILAEF